MEGAGAQLVAILFEASPGFQQNLQNTEVSASQPLSQSSLKRVLVSNSSNGSMPATACGWSQSSLKRVLVSNFRVPYCCNRILRRVAILFEASPGFQPRTREEYTRLSCSASQSSLKRVLVSN